MLTLTQIIILAIIQGVAELLPVSSSAHVIVVEKLMGLDPSAPEMTFLLVMLHTGTMFAVLVYFWRRWMKLNLQFFKNVIWATFATGVLGLSLKFIIEKLILARMWGESKAEIEHLFGSLPLIACALFLVGIFILVAGILEKSDSHAELTTKKSLLIGIVQGICLPFRGFSRSGATISTGLLTGISRELAESFSFALAVVITPAAIFLELRRLMKAMALSPELNTQMMHLLTPGLLGMAFSFLAGLVALHWLSNWLEKGRWKYFGIYCIVAAGGVLVVNATL